MRRPARVLVALALLAVAGCGGPRDVVLVTVDTLRADRLGLYGYAAPTSPAIDALAAESTVFENASATCPATGPAVASILTGQHRARHGVRRNDAELISPVRTLAEILQRHGYETVARVANPVLHPNSGFGQGFDDYRMPDGLEVVKPSMFEGSPVVRDTERVLAARSGKPLFLWLHFMDPHGPYFPSAECAAPFDPAGYRWPDEQDLPVSDMNWGLLSLPKYQVVGDYRTPAAYRARYDGEIRCTDNHVGAVVRLLREHGVWDRALFVLTADHGESLGEHQCYFQHGGYAYEDSLRVPLVVRAPGLVPAGKRVAETISMIDLAPTVLDLLGLPEEKRMEGRSLRPLLEGRAEHRPAFAQTFYGDGLVTLRLGDTKYVYTPGGREELYDLASDPGEKNDLSAREPARLATIRQQVEQWLRTQGGSAPRLQVPTPEVQEQMRALGYVN